jgi:hypothetical protein
LLQKLINFVLVSKFTWHIPLILRFVQLQRSELCSINILLAPSNAPLFTRPFGQPFSKSFFVLRIHELLLNAGISTGRYSGHSLRKGAAVTVDRNGISKHNIKLLGRWQSDAVDVYIDERQKPDYIQKLLHLNSQLLSPRTH